MEANGLYIAKQSDIMPSKRAYLARAGFKGTQPALDDKLRDVVNRIYMTGLDLAHGMVYYTTLTVDESGGCIPTDVIPGSFRGVQKITLFATTLGPMLDAQIAELAGAGHILQATLLDAWGSEAVESLNRFFDTELRCQYGKGTRRFSPGYGDVDIRVNSSILQMLQCDGIHANPDTGILTPRKSTICMIGWFDC